MKHVEMKLIQAYAAQKDVSLRFSDHKICMDGIYRILNLPDVQKLDFGYSCLQGNIRLRSYDTDEEYSVPAEDVDHVEILFSGRYQNAPLSAEDQRKCVNRYKDPVFDTRIADFMGRKGNEEAELAEKEKLYQLIHYLDVCLDADMECFIPAQHVVLKKPEMLVSLEKEPYRTFKVSRKIVHQLNLEGSRPARLRLSILQSRPARGKDREKLFNLAWRDALLEPKDDHWDLKVYRQIRLSPTGEIARSELEIREEKNPGEASLCISSELYRELKKAVGDNCFASQEEIMETVARLNAMQGKKRRITAEPVLFMADDSDPAKLKKKITYPYAMFSQKMNNLLPDGNKRAFDPNNPFLYMNIKTAGKNKDTYLPVPSYVFLGNGEKPMAIAEDAGEDRGLQAVRAAMNPENVTIINGPPGTGKTTTIVQIIIEAFLKRKTVLVTAVSNAAVEEAYQRTLQYFEDRHVLMPMFRYANMEKFFERTCEYRNRINEFRRLGNQFPDSTDENLSAVSMLCFNSLLKDSTLSDLFLRTGEKQNALHALLEGNYQNARKDADGTIMTAEKWFQKFLSCIPVIFTTAANAVNLFSPRKHLRGNQMFDLVIIDEASQCTIPQGLSVALLGRSMVLAGDNRQLRPITRVDEDLNEKIRQEYGVPDCYDYKERSIMGCYTSVDPYAAVHPRMIRLNEHHRCVNEIIGFSRQRFYRDMNIPDPVEKQDPSLAMICQRHQKQQVNSSLEEANAVLQQVETLLQNGLNNQPVGEKDISVICCFNNQKEVLERKVQSVHPGVSISTVHEFEGKENRIVIFSAAFNLEKGKGHEKGLVYRNRISCYEKFLSQKETVNVAVTRARERFVLVCDDETIGWVHEKCFPQDEGKNWVDEEDSMHALICYMRKKEASGQAVVEIHEPVGSAILQFTLQNTNRVERIMERACNAIHGEGYEVQKNVPVGTFVKGSSRLALEKIFGEGGSIPAVVRDPLNGSPVMIVLPDIYGREPLVKIEALCRQKKTRVLVIPCDRPFNAEDVKCAVHAACDKAGDDKEYYIVTKAMTQGLLKHRESVIFDMDYPVDESEKKERCSFAMKAEGLRELDFNLYDLAVLDSLYTAWLRGKTKLTLEGLLSVMEGTPIRAAGNSGKVGRLLGSLDKLCGMMVQIQQTDSFRQEPYCYEGPFLMLEWNSPKEISLLNFSAERNMPFYGLGEAGGIIRSCSSSCLVPDKDTKNKQNMHWLASRYLIYRVLLAKYSRHGMDNLNVIPVFRDGSTCDLFGFPELSGDSENDTVSMIRARREQYLNFTEAMLRKYEREKLLASCQVEAPQQEFGAISIRLSFDE